MNYDFRNLTQSSTVVPNGGDIGGDIAPKGRFPMRGVGGAKVIF